MIVGSLWSGEIRRLGFCSAAVQLAESTLGLPIIGLSHHSYGGKNICAYRADDAILADLCLADVLLEELELEIPERSVVLAFGSHADHTEDGAFAALAEALYTCVNAALLGQSLTVFSWAMRSFALQMRVPQLHCEHMIAEFVGLSQGANAATLNSYLAHIEPDQTIRKPQPALSIHLAQAETFDEWLDLLKSNYLSAATLGQYSRNYHE